MIQLEDLHVYETQLGNWRAYVRADPGLEAWGETRDAAIVNLARLLAEADEAFDFDI